MAERIEILRYSLPWDSPSGESKREGLLLRVLDTTGRIGIGEAAPLPGWSRESIGECRAALFRHAQNVARGGQLPDLPPSVRFAIEAAREDAGGWRGLPCRIPSLPLNALIDGGVERAIEKAARVIGEGCRTLKIKIRDRSAQETLFLLREIARMHPEVKLRPDANRSMDSDSLLAIWKFADGLPIEYFEEPVSDARLLPDLIRRHGVPIALDETLREIKPGALGTWKGAGAIVIKPTLLGGVRECMEWAAEGTRLGMAAVFSASYESGTGLYAIARMAASTEHPAAAGLDTYSTLHKDTLAERLGFAGWKVDITKPRPPLHPDFAGCAE